MNSPIHLLFDGKCAVYIFFAISGVYYYKKAEVLRPTVYLNGIYKKCLKIYPPYIIALLFAFALAYYTSHIYYNPALFTEWSNSFWHQQISVGELIRQSVILLPRNPDLIIPPSWYLTVEVRMFLLMPIMVFVLNYTSWWNLALLFLLSLVVDVSILSNLVFFSVAALSVKMMNTFDKIRTVFKLYKFFLLAIGIVLLDIENILVINDSEIVSYIIMLGAILIVDVFYVNMNFLDSKILVKLGSISYEFYLIHFVVLLSLKGYCVDPYAYVLVCFIISIGLSYLLKHMCNWGLKYIDAFNK